MEQVIIAMTLNLVVTNILTPQGPTKPNPRPMVYNVMEKTLAHNSHAISLPQCLS